MLACINSQRGIPTCGQPPAKGTLGGTLVAPAAPVNHDDQCRISYLLAAWLPQRGVDLKSIYCFDGEELERSASPQVKIRRKPGWASNEIVLNACRDLRCMRWH